MKFCNNTKSCIDYNHQTLIIPAFDCNFVFKYIKLCGFMLDYLKADMSKQLQTPNTGVGSLLELC